MTHPSAEFLDLQSALAGEYSLERELGRGGMGIVYLARDRRIDRLVAIKTLPPQLAADESMRQRFLRETRTAGAMELRPSSDRSIDSACSNRPPAR